MVAPLTFSKYIRTANWAWGSLMCKAVPALHVTNALVCSFSISTISVDRWIFILNTGKDQTKKLFLLVSIAFIWCLAIVISIPVFLVHNQVVYKVSGSNEVIFRVCEEQWTSGASPGATHNRELYSACVALFQYLLPVVVVVLTHLRICHFLINMPSFDSSGSGSHPPPTHFHHTAQNRVKTTNIIIDNDNSNTENSRKALVTTPTKPMPSSPLSLPRGGGEEVSFASVMLSKRQRFSRSRRILLIGCTSFILLWIPILVFNTYYDFFSSAESFENLANDEGYQSRGTLFLVCHVTATLTCCINPILYGYLNKNFYNELKRMMYQLMRRPVHQSSIAMSERNNQEQLQQQQQGGALAQAANAAMAVALIDLDKERVES
jgi:hypothetical protein